ncbi:hypothetical protein [Anaerococcus nagyae]|uniref:hypothetical protein n=1 Tax=Anaerococcus nagyae TaxID=1755241 RepID=UPI0015F3229F|nr:hypothetical protein [Anaerococcus nagyae]
MDRVKKFFLTYIIVTLLIVIYFYIRDKQINYDYIKTILIQLIVMIIVFYLSKKNLDK